MYSGVIFFFIIIRAWNCMRQEDLIIVLHFELRAARVNITIDLAIYNVNLFMQK